LTLTRLTAVRSLAWCARARARARIMLAALCGLLAVLAIPTAAQAAATKVVRYDGWHARVPASWPVFHLGSGSRICVRFNRHAVYLGRPGSQQRCPAHAVGRTEAILVTPRTRRTGALTGDAIGWGGSPAAAVPSAGAVAQVDRRGSGRTGGVLVTATWGQDPTVVRSALGVDSVRAAGRAYDRRQAAVLAGAARVTAHKRTRTPTGTRTASDSSGLPLSGDALARNVPGSVYAGLGFDACSAPSQTAMSAWAVASPFHAVGVYLGGANMACTQSNLTAAWVSEQAASGWQLIPTYVGLQAPGNGCGCAAISAIDAAAQGTAAAQSAVLEAQALGLGTGNPIYDDMENYTRTTSASETVLTFLGAWTTALHEAGYLSGVYSSELSGIQDLIAEQGTGYAEPDDIWFANWNGETVTTDPLVPITDWADNQRLHQFRGGHTDDYGGSSISVDSDYLDGATAAPGTETVTSTIAAAPTVTVSPQPDGAIRVRPSWHGESGVSRWQISAGNSPTTLIPLSTLPASDPTLPAADAYNDFQAEALNAAGLELGVSGPVATPSHVAVFGHSAFVATRGPGGLPVECYAISDCRVSTTMTLGHRTLVRTSDERVPAGGGIVHFPVSAAAHRLIIAAKNTGVPVTVTVHSSTGPSATRAMRLVRFTATGRGPRRLAGSDRALRILGVTDFVSHGFSGGILVACRQSTPCTATPTVHIGATTVATSRPHTIGSGEIGYLSFQMTAAGHVLLMHARGNQLGVGIQVTSAATGLATASRAHALVALDAF
jgi:hypothetical protein